MHNRKLELICPVLFLHHRRLKNPEKSLRVVHFHLTNQVKNIVVNQAELEIQRIEKVTVVFKEDNIRNRKPCRLEMSKTKTNVAF